MTKRAVFRSIFGIVAAALLTLSLGACVSGEKSMKKSSDTSMQDSTMKKDDAMKSDDTMKSDTSMKSTTSGNDTMKSSSTMSQ